MQLNAKRRQTPQSEIQAPKRTESKDKKTIHQSSALVELISNYSKSTTAFAKSLDLYLLFCLCTGITQAIYYLITGSHQYNAFLGGFISSVGSFVLAANLRLKESIQSDQKYSNERLIAEFVIGTVTLNLFVANFI